MGFLSGSDRATVDPSLKAIFVSGCAEKHDGKAHQLLARRQKHVLPVTNALRSGEEALLLVGKCDANVRPHGDYLLVTNQRTISICGSYTQEIEHGDVVEIEAGAAQFNVLVAIHSRTSRLDYHPNDNKRFEHIIVHKVATPRQGAQIRAAVERYIS